MIHKINLYLIFYYYTFYDNDSSNIAIYGNLYNWYAVDDNRGICPEYWHVPSDEEWKQLEMYLITILNQY